MQELSKKHEKRQPKGSGMGHTLASACIYVDHNNYIRPIWTMALMRKHPETPTLQEHAHT